LKPRWSTRRCMEYSISASIGYPHGHHPWCAPSGWPFEGWTSLDAGQKSALRFAAVLRISSDLKEEAHSCGRDEDWAVVYSTVLNEQARTSLKAPGNREAALNLLQLTVNDYLRLGEVRPMLARTPAAWKFFLSGNPLYPLLGKLVTELAVIVCGAEAVYTCSGCGHMYPREGARRRPKRGSANYCPGCGKPAAVLAAKRRYQSKIAEARKLRLDGLSVQEVARRVNSDPAKVRKWVRE